MPKHYNRDTNSRNQGGKERRRKQGGNKGNSSGGGRPDNSNNKKLSHALSWALRHQALNIGLNIQPDGYVPVEEILQSTHPRLKGCTIEMIHECVKTSDKQRFKLDYRPRHLFYEKDDDDVKETGVDEEEDQKNQQQEQHEKHQGEGEETEARSDETTILCIRANQGHSISIIDPNLLLSKISPESLRAMPCVVHGTYDEPWKMISQQGLKKMTRTHIHFAPGLPDNEQKVISGMRHSSTVYIFLDTEKCADDGIDFYESDNRVILTAGVLNKGTLPPEYFSYVTDSFGTMLMDNRK